MMWVILRAQSAQHEMRTYLAGRRGRLGRRVVVVRSMLDLCRANCRNASALFLRGWPAAS